MFKDREKLKSESSIGHSGVFSKDGKYYYQLSETDGLLFKVDANKLEFVKSIKVGEWPSIMVTK